MEDMIDDFQLQIDTDPCQYLRIVKVSSALFSCSRLSLPQRTNTSTYPPNLGMASLLNDQADKLDAADNNSNEPNPTNLVAEDKDENGTLVDILTVDEVYIVETRAC